MLVLWRRVGLPVAVAVAVLGSVLAVSRQGGDGEGPPAAGEVTGPAGPGSQGAPAAGSTAGTAGPPASGPGVPGESGEPPVGGIAVEPYVSESFLLLGSRDLSFRTQPWRGYLETVPAVRLLDGLGVNYNLPPDADHGAAVAALAAAGFRSARLEVSWAQIGADDRLQPGRLAELRAVLGAFAAHGVRPLVVLNANHADPGPHRRATRRVAADAAAGSRSIRLDAVDDLVAGHSGLSGLRPGDPMAAVIVTAVDAVTRTATLSRPLPVDLAAGTEVVVDTLRYAPLHPVGHEEFEQTAGGWLRYVDAVLGEVDAAGFAAYDVEIWNELTFGSDFLAIDNYYDPPAFGGAAGSVRPGGPAWELARRTVDAVHAGHPAATVLWGFSSTDFFGNPIDALPPGIDGQSYHPYHTELTPVPGEFPDGRERGRFDAVPELSMLLPEGRAHLALQQARLTTLLHPAARDAARPPGSDRFEHHITEHGFAPLRSGVTDPGRAAELEARALLRATTFWLGKGITRMQVSSAWKPDELDNGLLPSTDPRRWGGVAIDQLHTPALRALRTLTAAFDGAEPLARTRALDVRVEALGDQPDAFAGLPYREMFTALPFQVDGGRFVVAFYVMGWNLLDPPPPMAFSLTIGGVDGHAATAAVLDPLTGATEPAAVTARTDGSVTVTVEASDTPRLLQLTG
jgi:hypothetical protein